MEFDTLILGAGAAGLFCAAHAGGRCLVIDHSSWSVVITIPVGDFLLYLLRNFS